MNVEKSLWLMCQFKTTFLTNIIYPQSLAQRLRVSKLTVLTVCHRSFLKGFGSFGFVIRPPLCQYSCNVIVAICSHLQTGRVQGQLRLLRETLSPKGNGGGAMYVIATAALMLGSETHPEPQTVLQELYLSESLNLQKNGFH